MKEAGMSSFNAPSLFHPETPARPAVPPGPRCRQVGSVGEVGLGRPSPLQDRRSGVYYRISQINEIGTPSAPPWKFAVRGVNRVELLDFWSQQTYFLALKS